MLVGDLTKVLEGVICEAESLGGITDIRCTTSSIGNHNVAWCVRYRIQFEIDITVRRRVQVDLGWIGLIEEVEEAGPQLEALALADLEVLEQRDVEVASARITDIERNLIRPGLTKRRDGEGIDVEDSIPHLRIPADRRITEIYGRHRSNILVAVIVESVGSIPGPGHIGGGDIAREPQTDR